MQGFVPTFAQPKLGFWCCPSFKSGSKVDIIILFTMNDERVKCVVWIL